MHTLVGAIDSQTTEIRLSRVSAWRLENVPPPRVQFTYVTRTVESGVPFLFFSSFIASVSISRGPRGIINRKINKFDRVKTTLIFSRIHNFFSVCLIFVRYYYSTHTLIHTGVAKPATALGYPSSSSSSLLHTTIITGIIYTGNRP